MDFLGSVLSSYVGLKMQVFRLPKVLAVGQTSGSGGWVKKISLDIDKGNGIVVGRRQSKKTMRRSLCFLLRGFEEGRMDLILVIVFPRERQNSENSLCLGKCVAHTNKSCWSVSLTRQTNYSRLVWLQVTHLTFSCH